MSFVAIQGAGGGGLLAITSIVISDLVPLAERAMYNGLVGLYVSCPPHYQLCTSLTTRLTGLGVSQQLWALL